MAQSLEVTETINNGKTYSTEITKSYNSRFVKRARGVAVGSDNFTEVFMKGRATKDLRRVRQDYATVLAAINGLEQTLLGNDRVMSLTVKARGGDLESNITPYLQMFPKNDVVEFYADPNDSGDSIVITQAGKNNQERQVWTVDEDYAGVKALWLL